jgi:hypothetical protein
MQNRRIFCPCFAREVGHRLTLLLAEPLLVGVTFACNLVKRSVLSSRRHRTTLLPKPVFARLTQGAGYSVVQSGSPAEIRELTDPPGVSLRAYGRASRIMLNGVSAARLTLRNPPAVMTSRNRASPACAPSAAPTS